MQNFRNAVCAILLLSSTSQFAHAQQRFFFNINPFTGSTAPATPGRQVVGGEPSLNFNIATDVLAFDRNAFNIGSSINFANGLAGSLATSGLNAIVLQSFDDDANSATPFGAGNAANLIAARITNPGAGLFMYFNSGLNLGRLVYSADLNDNTADLQILARFTNLSGQAGRDAFPDITAANFELVTTVPEPSSLLMCAFGLTALVGVGASRKNRRTKV